MIPFIWHSWKDSIIVIGTVFYFGCDVYSTYISSGYGIQFSKLPEIHTKKGEILLYVQFSSGAQSCLTLSNPINCRTSGLPVHHQLPEFTQLHVHCQWCHPAISSSVDPFSSCPQSLPASGSFPMSQLFAWGGQSIGVSASASVLPMNTQDQSPSEWTGWISLQSKRLSRVFSNTTVQNHQFFSAQLSSQSNSHIHTRPLEKP